MNYYQHHIGDFIRDTARLSDAQAMAYLRMIWMYYETEEPLESDVEALAFKIGATASDVHQILKHFFFEFEGKWHHSRCNKEILAFRERSRKAKESASARWDNAKAMRTHIEGSAPEVVCNANQEPVTNNQEGKPSTSEQSPDAEKPTKRKHHGSEEDHKAAHWMFEQVLKINATASTPNWNGWANDIRLMREIDGRDHKAICEMFLFANRDHFWSSNILSPGKLREKWDTLAAKRSRDPNRSGGSAPSSVTSGGSNEQRPTVEYI